MRYTIDQFPYNSENHKYVALVHMFSDFNNSEEQANFTSLVVRAHAAEQIAQSSIPTNRRSSSEG